MIRCVYSKARQKGRLAKIWNNSNQEVLLYSQWDDPSTFIARIPPDGVYQPGLKVPPEIYLDRYMRHKIDISHYRKHPYPEGMILISVWD